MQVTEASAWISSRVGVQERVLWCCQWFLRGVEGCVCCAPFAVALPGAWAATLVAHAPRRGRV